MKKTFYVMLLTLIFSTPLFVHADPSAAVPEKSVKTKKARKKKKMKKAAAAPANEKSTVKLSEVKEEPVKTDTFQAWLQGLKQRFSQSESRSNKLVSVAAVRGDETSDAPPLYWKGKKAETQTEVPEMKEFEQAVDVALAGDKIAAKEKLQSFVLAYPNSPLKGDAEETLRRLEAN